MKPIPIDEITEGFWWCKGAESCPLEQEKLSVNLVPAPEQMHTEHKIRIKTSENPKCYRELCGQYLDISPRRCSTIIRRKVIVKYLKQLVKDGYTSSKYGFDLLAIAKEMNNGLRPDYYWVSTIFPIRKR